MKKQIVINASKDRSRIAIVEDGELVELYVENPENVRTLGNIYLGNVQKVMPAIRAAFVDVGQKQDCFLHFSDLTDNFPQLQAMAGIEVPGLDKPMLSLAPKKQVADDESEPDVEDKLEIEDNDEEAPKTRSSRGRRSRGRGRGGRGRSQGGNSSRPEEEEEQEEAGEGSGKRLPMVIDLTAKPSRPAPKPAPKRAAAPEGEPAAAEAEVPKPKRRSRAKKSEETAETEAPTEEKPKATRSRRVKPAAASAASDSPEPSTDAEAVTEAKPKRARPSRAKKAPEDTPKADEAASDEPAAEERPKRSRSRRKPAAEETSEVTDSAEEKPKATRSRRAKPAEEETDESSKTEERPKRSRSRKAGPASTDAGETPEPASASSDDTDTTDGESGDDSESTGRPRRRRRGGRGRGRGRSSDEASQEGDDPAQDAAAGTEADAEKSERPSRNRGGRSRATDSDSGAKNESSDSPDASADPEAAAPRGRRQSRSRGSDSSGQDANRSAPRDQSNSDTSRRSNGDSGRRDRSGSRASGQQSSSGNVPSNEQLLKRNSPVIVKITKEPISTKGSRASTDLSIAGRFLVLVPAADYVAVSKKIESAKERRRLRMVASSLKPDGFGVIVRTVADGRDAKSLDTDMRLLTDKWRKIENKLAEKPKPPVLLYEDVNMVSSIIRDLFSEDYDQIVVDDPRVFKNVQTYVRAIAPSMADKVLLHTSATPVFRAMSIERQVEEAFSKRVNMKGGGYLFIETTEAMHVVDVNSGRAGRGKSQKENLISVNVEAAKEVAKQLRLRDLGGIIVVDFIDLRHESDRRKVTTALKDAFAKDRAVTKLLPMSDFGLVQITRQRLRPSITTAGAEDGDLDPAEAARLAGAAEIEQPERGYTKEEPAAAAPSSSEPRVERIRPEMSLSESTPEALTGALRSWLDNYRRTVDASFKARPIVVRVHPLFAAFLKRGFPSPLTRWRLTIRGITYRIEEDPSVDPLSFDVRDEKSGRTLMKKYSV